MEHLKALIKLHIEENGPNCSLNHIDTSRLTSMSHLFYGSEFNGDISQWDVSNVKDMSHMFYKSCFNGDISQWNTRSVTDTFDMFSKSKFNRDISKWNMENVTDMRGMFNDSKFTKDISRWRPVSLTHSLINLYEGKAKHKPYWARIENKQERITAIFKMDNDRLNEKIESTANTNENHFQKTKKIKI